MDTSMNASNGSLLALAGLLAAYSIASLGMGIPPLIVTAGLELFHVGNVQAGLLYTVELATIAVVLSTCALLSTRLRYRAACVFGIMLVLFGCLVPALTSHYPWGLMARATSGLGSGLILYATNALACQTRDPTRTFARMYAASVFFVSAVYFAVPALGRGSFASILFPVMLGACLVLLPLTKGLPSQRMPPQPTTATASSFKSIPLGLVLIFVGNCLFNLSTATVYGFIEQFGNRAGLSLEHMSFVMSAASIIGFMGPAILGVVGTRYGHDLPLAAALLIAIIAIVMVGMVHQPSVLSIGAILLVVASSAAIPLFLGYAGDFDPTGAWSSLTTVALVGSIAFGPLLGGVLADAFGLRATAIASLTLMLAACIPCGLLARMKGPSA